MNAMAQALYKTALIVGAGQGLSASIARVLAREGLALALAARDPGKLGALCEETGAAAFGCDAQDEKQVAQLFDQVNENYGSPDVVIYNASGRPRRKAAATPARMLTGMQSRNAKIARKSERLSAGTRSFVTGRPSLDNEVQQLIVQLNAPEELAGGKLPLEEWSARLLAWATGPAGPGLDGLGKVLESQRIPVSINMEEADTEGEVRLSTNVNAYRK